MDPKSSLIPKQKSLLIRNIYGEERPFIQKFLFLLQQIRRVICFAANNITSHVSSVMEAKMMDVLGKVYAQPQLKNLSKFAEEMVNYGGEGSAENRFHLF